MNITDVRLYKYSLPLLLPLRLDDETLMTREGFLIKIIGESELSGVSEIAPLPFFSKESSHDVIKDISSFKNEFNGKPIPTDILERTKLYVPSVQFGVETALLNLHASFKKLTFADLLNPNAKREIKVNALLDGSIDEIESKLEFLMMQGYKTFKIKIGRNSFDDEIKLIEKIQNKIDSSYSIRLDANRSFDLKSGIEFLDSLNPDFIEYIEEPFTAQDELLTYLNDGKSKLPIALDETIREIQIDELQEYKHCEAVILKPTLMGYANAIQFAKSALTLDMKPVISSSFESSIGIYILASIASVINDSISVGLETISWFAQDTIPQPLMIEHGIINLDDYVMIFEQVDFSKFEEIALG